MGGDRDQRARDPLRGGVAAQLGKEAMGFIDLAGLEQQQEPLGCDVGGQRRETLPPRLELAATGANRPVSGNVMVTAPDTAGSASATSPASVAKPIRM